MEAHARADRKGQSAFEFLLLVTGAVLFVVLAVAVVRSGINTNANSANNTAGGYQDYLAVQAERASVSNDVFGFSRGGRAYSSIPAKNRGRRASSSMPGWVKISLFLPENPLNCRRPLLRPPISHTKPSTR